MAAANVTEVPTFTGTINQGFLIEPLGGPKHPRNYLDRFPDELYNKSPESHVFRFIYTLLGPAGVGWLRKNYLEARLRLEDLGVDLGDLDAFYGNPFQFGRVFEETYDEDPTGILTQAQWQQIKAKDAQYRARALDFVSGVRLGNTPAGMRLVAKSGLGRDVEIIENYRYLYDIHSDLPRGLPYFGQTTSTEEMIVLPRNEVPRSEQQTITITGNPTGGDFSLTYDGQTSATVPYSALDSDIQAALEALPNIGVGQVRVTGGPGPLNAWIVFFIGALSSRDVPQLVPHSNLTGPDTYDIIVDTDIAGIQPTDEIAVISPRDSLHAVTAIERIKPMTTLPTFGIAPGLRTVQTWGTVVTSSEFSEVVRFVTGQADVIWPSDSAHWIRRDVEQEAPRVDGEARHHYQGFHNVTNVTAYTDAALDDINYSTVGSPPSTISQHIGQYNPPQRGLFPLLDEITDDHLLLSADRALADYPEPLTTTASVEGDNNQTIPLVNGIYPADYASLPGVPQIVYHDDQFWGSLERQAGSEFLEIDLGTVQAVNFLAFEITRKPIKITISYDLRDAAPERAFTPVMPQRGVTYPDSIIFMPEDQSPWEYVQYNFTNGKGDIPFTRFIRVEFARISNAIAPFLYDPLNNVQSPWSIEVRNLRVGRNIV